MGLILEKTKHPLNQSITLDNSTQSSIEGTQDKSNKNKTDLERDEIIKKTVAEINQEAEKKTWNNQDEKQKWAREELVKRLPDNLATFYKEKIEKSEQEKIALESSNAEQEKKLKGILAELNQTVSLEQDTNARELKLPKLRTEDELKNSKMNSLASKGNQHQDPKESDKKTETSILETKSLSYSFKTDQNTYRQENFEISLNKDGSVSANKTNTNNEKVDVSSKFCALFLGSDNILRDKDGNKIQQIQSAHGNINASFVPNIISKFKSDGKILEIDDKFLKNFSHEGKQIVFVKGNPESLKVIEKTIDKAQADKKLEQVKDIPWTKYNYIEQINGQYIEKSAFVRVNQNQAKPQLEIFMGKDYQGNDIWVNANSVSHPKLSLVTIKKDSKQMISENGRDIENFSSVSGTYTNAKSVLNSLEENNKNHTKALGFKKEYFNDLLIDGKRPVFFSL